MSQEQPKRSVVEIQQEYTQLCAKAGHIQYNLHVLNQDLEMVNGQLKELNFEAAAANKREQDAAAKKVSEIKPVEVVS